METPLWKWIEYLVVDIPDRVSPLKSTVSQLNSLTAERDELKRNYSGNKDETAITINTNGLDSKGFKYNNEPGVARAFQHLHILQVNKNVVYNSTTM